MKNKITVGWMYLIIVLLLAISVAFSGCETAKTFFDFVGIESGGFTETLEDGTVLKCKDHESKPDIWRCSKLDPNGDIKWLDFNFKTKKSTPVPLE